MGQDLPSRDIVDLVKDECKVAKKYALEAMARAETILKAREECDKRIEQVCKDYKIGRIQSVERNILRLAIFEAVLEKEIPLKVVFAEAKRLAKKFSTAEAASFVHALLGATVPRTSTTTEEAPNLEEAYRKLSEAEEEGNERIRDIRMLAHESTAQNSTS